MNYNLLEERWIPTLRTNGRFERLGIRAALVEAGNIRQIAASNPMDNVALLRFLLAVLKWCKESLTDEKCKRVDTAEGIPGEWVNEVEKHTDAFDLLGDTHRFYQDQQVQSVNDRPIGDLLQEFPTETKVAHFRHVRDGEYGLCPSCCAMGIIRFSAFANAYGGGRYTAAVNGPTPAYAIAHGLTLLQTLLLNLPVSGSLKREPPWLCTQAPQLKDLDAVTVFAWRSRRLWLGDAGTSDEPCSYCGQPARLIRQLAFTGNWKPPFKTRGTEKKFWDQDPHLILEEKEGEADDTEDIDRDNDYETKVVRKSGVGRKKTVTTLGVPFPGSRVAAHARFWRRALSAIFARADSGRYRTMPLAMSVAGPAANKGLYQDAVALSLPFAETDRASAAMDGIKFLDRVVRQLVAVLRQSTPNPKRQHPNRKAALDALSPSLETCLRADFARWLKGLAPRTGEGAPPSVEFWRGQLIEQLGPVVEAVVSATTPGSPLHRLEATEKALQALDRAMTALAKPDRNEPRPEDNKKDSNGRKKRGGA